MDLNKYLPNKTLLWKDARIAWGIMFIFFIYLTLNSSVKLIYSIKNVTEYPDLYANTVALPQMDLFSAVILFFSVVVLAGNLIGIERDQSVFNQLLAMPYTRGQILNSKYLLGFIFLLAAFVFNAALMSAACWASSGVTYFFTIGDIWLWSMRYTLVLWFIFSFSIFISTISGNTAGNYILSIIFLLFPAGFLYLVGINGTIWFNNIIEWFFNLGNWDGVIYNIIMLLTVPSYIIQGQSFWDQYSHPLLYMLLILATAIFCGLSHYLFARNQMENNGEVLMFPGLELFFKTGVTVCFALLIAPILIYYFDIRPADGLGSAAIAATFYLVLGAGIWFGVQKLINWRKAT